MSSRRSPFAAARTGTLLLLVAAASSMGFVACEKNLPKSGKALFLSPQSNPLALSNDGQRLYVANTTSGTLSVLDVSNAGAPSTLAEIPVGLDPVGVAVRPGLVNGDELVLVTNHISDSVSVVSRNRLAVVQTVQGLEANGVTTTDEPVGVAFSGPDRAFVALDQPNQVLVLDVAADGKVSLHPQRLAITAQAPRALAARDGKLYVASFESGNQTELPICDPTDTRGLTENDGALTDEGCEYKAEIIEGINLSQGGLVLGTIFDFAASNPNIGGRVIRDTDLPDRDLFVFDATTFALEQVVDTVGTLLYGLAAGPGGRLYVSNTDARNHLDGLGAIDNKMFDNRLSVLDCGGSCGAPTHVDLDAGAAGLGQTVPTPHGVAVSADGETVVVTAAGADGDPGDERPPMHGLFVLDANGNAVGSALAGALPEGVALRSGPSGSAQTAFVLNGADSTVSVVDLSNPATPVTQVAGYVVGEDPTPPQIRLGRIAFSSGRAATNGTFACASCHPHGNIDQLLWTINTVTGPDDGPDATGNLAEPRASMPIRGLRDTLPLHWEGVLSDPIPGVNRFAVFDEAPDCDLATDGEIGCVRHLVDAALSGPMCQHNGPQGCVPGPGQTGPGGANLPGNLTEAERDAMAAFQVAVSFPPSPTRRPNDRLSDAANGGVSDFFTDEDGQGIRGDVGQAVNFAPATCADNAMGCHALPLTVSTNSNIVGGFDAPSARGMWDRWINFSNGITTAQEVLVQMQDCADGIVSPDKSFVLGSGPQAFNVTIKGDPCNLESPQLGAFLGFQFAQLPFPSGAQIYDPAVGMTERGSFLSSFETIFSLVYGVRGDRIWEYQTEMSVGLPGLTGRQLELNAANATDAAVGAALAEIQEAGRLGKVTAVARGAKLREVRLLRASNRWTWPSGISMSTAELRDVVKKLGDVVTVTAELPDNISIGGPDRQPLLDVDPDLRALEVTSDAPSVPKPPQNQVATIRLGAQYVDTAATVLVNGSPCPGCTFSPGVAPETGKGVIDLTLSPGLSAGVHVVQVLNPNGWASNEMPVCATNGVDVCTYE